MPDEMQVWQVWPKVWIVGKNMHGKCSVQKLDHQGHTDKDMNMDKDTNSTSVNANINIDDSRTSGCERECRTTRRPC